MTQNDTLDKPLKTHLKSSVISLRLAWKGMFLTNIFVLFCFFSVFDFFFLVVAGLNLRKQEDILLLNNTMHTSIHQFICIWILSHLITNRTLSVHSWFHSLQKSSANPLSLFIYKLTGHRSSDNQPIATRLSKIPLY